MDEITFEWKEMRQSTTGQRSTGSSRIVFSEKMYVLMYSNSSSRVKISFIGLLNVFFSMAHTPTTTW